MRFAWDIEINPSTYGLGLAAVVHVPLEDGRGRTANGFLLQIGPVFVFVGVTQR